MDLIFTNIDVNKLHLFYSETIKIQNIYNHNTYILYINI